MSDHHRQMIRYSGKHWSLWKSSLGNWTWPRSCSIPPRSVNVALVKRNHAEKRQYFTQKAGAKPQHFPTNRVHLGEGWFLTRLKRKPEAEHKLAAAAAAASAGAAGPPSISARPRSNPLPNKPWKTSRCRWTRNWKPFSRLGRSHPAPRGISGALVLSRSTAPIVLAQVRHQTGKN